MSAVVEQYANHVRQLTQQGEFDQLCETISKFSEGLAKHPGLLDNLLATFNVQEHSLGVLGILCIKFNVSTISSDSDSLLTQTSEFLVNCNGEQVRCSPDNFAVVCHRYSEALIRKKQAKRGIRPLMRAVEKLQTNENQLTSAHADLCLLCLQAKVFKPVVRYLDCDIDDINTEKKKFDVKHFLLYCYYGGMIYTGLKNYDRALFLFENAITVPAVAVSHIVIEAYKKYICVSLLADGKLRQLPKYTSNVIPRYVKQLCQAYHNLAHAYCSNDPNQVTNVIAKSQQDFVRDEMLGLVKQTLVSLYKRNIQRLTKTFVTLSLSDMANRVGLENAREAEKYVLQMISDGQVYAKIDQHNGMVTFLDCEQSSNTVNMQEYIDKRIGEFIKLDEKIQAMDRSILTNPQFVQKSHGQHDEESTPSTIRFPIPLS
ncbi:DgyrCDS5166 [Dimorphilus gyrociliatus]|uniref:COP9 signalosome complex subunit 3 n=1 Tax=Dimorphilus gyrociliatus TaxID=2664684 RepID=A0A7I8VKN3_9ANNE|nr:DgyrCDS5166 [Dimorphilus gyrociliatus]